MPDYDPLKFPEGYFKDDADPEKEQYDSGKWHNISFRSQVAKYLRGEMSFEGLVAYMHITLDLRSATELLNESFMRGFRDTSLMTPEFKGAFVAAYHAASEKLLRERQTQRNND